MSHRTYIFTLFVVVASFAGAQESRRLPRDTVAWVDGLPITASELRARIELMPWPEPLRPSTADSVKSHALAALIAERLLSSEALSSGLGSTVTIRRLQKGLMSSLLKDELYRTEVIGKLRPTKAQTAEALRRYRENRSVLALLVSHETIARDLVAAIRRARDRDSILQAITPEMVLDRDTIVASFGMSDTSLENAAYGIGRSAVSQPIRAGANVWAVFVLLDRSPNPTAQKQGAADQARSAEKIVQQRLDGIVAERFYSHTLSEKRAQADSNLFQTFANAVASLWTKDSSRYHRPEGYQITSQMIDALHIALEGLNVRPFVTLDDGSMSLEEVVEMFRYENFVSPEREGEMFLSRLNEAVRLIVGGEYLAREARKRHLENSVTVRNDMKTWTDYWAAGEILSRIRDTVLVDRSDLVAYLSEHKAEYLGLSKVWIQEVFSASAVDAAAVSDGLGKGTPISQLAAERSKRTSWASADGSSGWFDPVNDATVGFHALLADSGALVGPIRVDPGFSTFRVIDVRTDHGMLHGKSLSQSLEQPVRSEKSRKSISSTVAELARRHAVRVERAQLRKMTITLRPMFTRRYLGFGGSMNGAPMLLPLWEWTKQLPPGSQLP